MRLSMVVVVVKQQVGPWRELLDLTDEDELDVAQHRHNLFVSPSSVYYVDCHHDNPTVLGAIEARLRLFGAQITDQLDVTVTHVVVDKRETGRFPELANKLRELRWSPGAQLEKRVVDKEWVTVCCEEMCLPLVETDQYQVDIWGRRGEE